MQNYFARTIFTPRFSYVCIGQEDMWLNWIFIPFVLIVITYNRSNINFVGSTAAATPCISTADFHAFFSRNQKGA